MRLRHNTNRYLKIVEALGAFDLNKEAYEIGEKPQGEALDFAENLLSRLREIESIPEYIEELEAHEVAWIVWQKTDGRCSYCDAKLNPFDRQASNGFHVDHVIPRVKGGPNSTENLVPACAKCNSSKGGRTPEEWRASNGC